MKVRILAFFMAVLMVFCLCACGDENNCEKIDTSSNVLVDDGTEKGGKKAEEKKPVKKSAKSDKNSITDKDTFMSIKGINVKKVNPGEQSPELKSRLISGKNDIKREEYYQYDSLTSTEKKVYNKLCSAIERTQNFVDVSEYSIRVSSAANILQKLIADNPGYFWLSKNSSLKYDKEKDRVFTYILLYSDGETVDSIDSDYKIKHLCSRDTIAAKLLKLNQKTDEFLKTVPENFSDIYKERFIHDFIIKSVDYDSTVTENSTDENKSLPHAFDIYGALVERSAVCEGYSKLFQYLCYRTGINCTEAVGTARGGEHMWNTVKIGENWAHVDVTWDDTMGGGEVPYYGYFNVVTAKINDDRDIDTSVLSQPTCSEKSLSFSNYFALIYSSADKTVTNVEESLDMLNDVGDYLVIYGINGILPEKSFLESFVFDDNSTVKKYISRNDYDINIENKQINVGKFVYIPVKKSQ